MLRCFYGSTPSGHPPIPTPTHTRRSFRRQKALPTAQQRFHLSVCVKHAQLDVLRDLVPLLGRKAVHRDGTHTVLLAVRLFDVVVVVLV